MGSIDRSLDPRHDDDGATRGVAVHHSGGSNCGSYRAGHDPHWIQVLRVAPRGEPVALRDVRLIDRVTLELDVDRVDGDGGVDAGGDGRGDGRETLVRRNHDAVQAFATWTRCGEGRLVHGASLLQVGPASGAATFSVAAGDLGPCSSDQGGAR